jgi:hypothetical protein
MAISVTVDTSVMVKALVPPRRRKRDELYEAQLNLISDDTDGIKLE